MTATWSESDVLRQPVAGPPHRPGSERMLPTGRLGPVSESPTIRLERLIHIGGSGVQVQRCERNSAAIRAWCEIGIPHADTDRAAR